MPSNRFPPGSASKPLLGGLEQETELWHFIKLSVPKWSKPKKIGHSQAAVVLGKLRSIGVRDLEDLFTRLERNTLSDELKERGLGPISRDGLAAMRNGRPFSTIMKDVDVPHVRGFGTFDPALQMMADHRISPYPTAQMSSPTAAERSKSEGSLKFSWRPPLHGTGPLPRSPDPFEATCSPFGSAPRLRDARWTLRKHRQRSLGALQSLPASPSRTLDGFGRDATQQEPQLASTAPLPPTMTVTINLPAEQAASSRPASRASDSRNGAAMTLPAGKWSRMTSGAPGEQGSTPNSSRSRGVSRAEDDLRPVSFDEVERLVHAGRKMAQRSEDRSGACWSCLRNKSLLEQGEEMLKEQAAREEQRLIIKQAYMPENMPEYTNGRANLKGHIAEKIALRLREDKLRKDRGAAVQIDATCINIRKQLEHLGRARNEVRGMRNKVQTVIKGDHAAAVEAQKEDKYDLFRKKPKETTTPSGQKSAALGSKEIAMRGRSEEMQGNLINVLDMV
mmetsp:Transcript_63280/g.185617  ORF Transcript_63280/g.185617 Transcript_63280/m.185617 type:complete len:506 (-) Transcript_63280:64-1581(-)